MESFSVYFQKNMFVYTEKDCLLYDPIYLGSYLFIPVEYIVAFCRYQSVCLHGEEGFLGSPFCWSQGQEAQLVSETPSPLPSDCDLVQRIGRMFFVGSSGLSFLLLDF